MKESDDEYLTCDSEDEVSREELRDLMNKLENKKNKIKELEQKKESTLGLNKISEQIQLLKENNDNLTEQIEMLKKSINYQGTYEKNKKNYEYIKELENQKMIHLKNINENNEEYTGIRRLFYINYDSIEDMKSKIESKKEDIKKLICKKEKRFALFCKFKDYLNDLIEISKSKASVYKLYLKDPISYENNKKKVKKIVNPTVGLENPKGYCYLNTVLQILYSCDNFIQQTIKISNEDDKYIFYKETLNLMKAMNERNTEMCNVYHLNLISLLKGNDEGDDIQKCFSNLFNKMNTGKNERRARSILPILKENFYGELTRVTECKTCGYSKSKKEMFKEIIVPILTEEEVNLEENIKLSTADTSLQCDYKLCKCKIVEEAELLEKTNIIKLPKFLFIYLNRGVIGDENAKLNMRVKFKETLIINEADGPVQYKILSVGLHMGSGGGGHFYCLGKFNTDRWWVANDTQITQMAKDFEIQHMSDEITVFMVKRVS